MSPPMRLRDDPSASLKKTLKKHGLEDYLDFFSDVWNTREPRGPLAVKRAFIAGNSTFDAKNSDENFALSQEVDLNDPATWGDIKVLPSDEFFAEVFKAMVADQKRYDKRGSYEF